MNDKPKQRPPRIFLGLFEDDGLLGRLTKEFEAAGCDVITVTITSHPCRYEFPPLRGAARLMRWWAVKRLGLSRSTSYHRVPRWLLWLFNQTLALIAALHYDIFIFTHGIGLTDGSNLGCLRMFRLFRRKIVYILDETDSLPPYCERTGQQLLEREDGLQQLHSKCREKAAFVNHMHIAADLIIDHPLNNHLHPHPYLNKVALGHIAPTTEIPTRLPSQTDATTRAVRILHCAAAGNSRGTYEIRAIIDRLRPTISRPIEYIELIDVPHVRIAEELKLCDFVLDQLYGHDPMSMFASEAAYYCKAAMVGGYAWDDLKPFLPADCCPPTIRCLPQDFETTLRDFINAGPAYWLEAGTAAGDFVRQHRPVGEFARTILSTLREKNSNHMVSPDQASYVWGTGLHAFEVAATLHTMMKTLPLNAFCLENKPMLLSKTCSAATLDSDPMSNDSLLLGLKLDAGSLDVLKELFSRQTLLEKSLLALSPHNQAVRDEWNKEIRQQHQMEINGLLSKLDNFRGMIERRNKRIEKLEKKLKIKRKPTESGLLPDK